MAAAAKQAVEVRRVKVYQLNEQGQWDDKGTGNVIFTADNGSQILTVRHEESNQDLLTHAIEPGIDYQRQGETIITWCDTGGSDLALSFQEVTRCVEVWDHIRSINTTYPAQQMIPQQGAGGFQADGETDQEPTDVGSDGDAAANAAMAAGGMTMLPMPELSNLEELNARISGVALAAKEAVSQSLLKEGFIQRLFELFRIAEAAKPAPRLDSLQQIFGIFKGVFLLNDCTVLEQVLNEENIMPVIACLEYDPDLPPGTSHFRHREFMAKAAFKQVVPIADEDVLGKIHQNYRMTYIKDVILLRYLDDPTMGTLTSIIFFNNVVIVSRLSDNPTFMKELFGKLQAVAGMTAPGVRRWVEPTGSSNARMEDGSGNASAAAAAKDSKNELREVDYSERKNLFLFLQELCTLAKSLQVAIRDAFYKTLVDYGVFGILEDALLIAEPKHQLWLWLAATDILTNMLNHDPQMLRLYLLSRIAVTTPTRPTLLGRLVNICVSDVGSGLSHQLAQILRMLFDPESMQPNDKDNFLEHIYTHHIQKLVDALTPPDAAAKANHSGAAAAAAAAAAVVSPRNSAAYVNAQDARYHACELLSFCVLHHATRIKNYIGTRPVISKVLSLLKSESKHLVCSAIRFLRTCIGLKDEFYIKRIVSQQLLDPVMDVFSANGSRYNLLNSAVLELVNYIKTENVRELVEYLVHHHANAFAGVTYVQTFKQLKEQYEANLRQPADSKSGSNGANGVDSGKDEPHDSSAYFETDDDDPPAGPALAPTGLTDDLGAAAGSGVGRSGLHLSPTKQDIEDQKFMERVKKGDDEVDFLAAVSKRRAGAGAGAAGAGSGASVGSALGAVGGSSAGSSLGSLLAGGSSSSSSSSSAATGKPPAKKLKTSITLKIGSPALSAATAGGSPGSPGSSGNSSPGSSPGSRSPGGSPQSASAQPPKSPPPKLSFVPATGAAAAAAAAASASGSGTSLTPNLTAFSLTTPPASPLHLSGAAATTAAAAAAAAAAGGSASAPSSPGGRGQNNKKRKSGVIDA